MRGVSVYSSMKSIESSRVCARLPAMGGHYGEREPGAPVPICSLPGQVTAPERPSLGGDPSGQGRG